jgi:hypothetical protein
MSYLEHRISFSPWTFMFVPEQGGLCERGHLLSFC